LEYVGEFVGVQLSPSDNSGAVNLQGEARIYEEVELLGGLRVEGCEAVGSVWGATVGGAIRTAAAASRRSGKLSKRGAAKQQPSQAAARPGGVPKIHEQQICRGACGGEIFDEKSSDISAEKSSDIFAEKSSDISADAPKQFCRSACAGESKKILDAQSPCGPGVAVTKWADVEDEVAVLGDGLVGDLSLGSGPVPNGAEKLSRRQRRLRAAEAAAAMLQPHSPAKCSPTSREQLLAADVAQSTAWAAFAKASSVWVLAEADVRAQRAALRLAEADWAAAVGLGSG
jgi:hypothetical protein